MCLGCSAAPISKTLYAAFYLPLHLIRIPRGRFIAGAYDVPVVDCFVSSPALREFALSLHEVSQVGNSYNVLRLLVHIDELQLTILPFGGQIDAHQHSETKTIQVGHVF
jgi:hypothetical protein